jgi:hypothetical protein
MFICVFNIVNFFYLQMIHDLGKIRNNSTRFNKSTSYPSCLQVHEILVY